MNRAAPRFRFLRWLLLVGAAVPMLSATSSASPDGASTLLLRVEDSAGASLVARVRVAPHDWAERVRLQLWSDINVLTRDGRAQLSLSPGHYEVVVSHGTEWSLSRSELQLLPGGTAHRTAVLEHQVWLPGWHGADLHVHTERSEDAKSHGGVSAAALVAEGIELAVGTDHNQIGDLGPGIDSVAGAEVTTWQPEVGHFNAFPLQRLPTWRGTSPAKLFAELQRDPNVFVQVNHPRLDDHIAYFTLGGFDGDSFAQRDFNLNVHGLEVWNGYDIARPEKVDGLLREWRGWVARGKRLTATGGSDCHGANNHQPGYPRTYVQTDTAETLAPTLKAGRAFVTNGPLLSLTLQKHQAGDSVELTKRRVDVELTVLAPDWMDVERAEIWAGETLAWSAPIKRQRADVHAPLRFTTRVTVDVGDARTLHAVARGGGGLDALLGRGGVEPLAFTNPLYLHHDTDRLHATRESLHVALERTAGHRVIPDHRD